MIGILLTILIAVPFALLLAAVVATTVIAVLKKGPVLFSLMLALAGVAAALGFMAFHKSRRSWNWNGWRDWQSAYGSSRSHAGSRSDSASNGRTSEREAVGNLGRGAARDPIDDARREKRENQYAADARKLVEEIKETLKTSPISAQQKAALLAQVREIPDSAARALRKINRLRKIRDIANRMPHSDTVAQTLRDIDALERQLFVELQRMRETLLEISVGLMRVDAARGDKSLDRLVAELSETNQRLSDLADSYGDVKQERTFQF
jgi:hypothetical protein